MRKLLISLTGLLLLEAAPTWAGDLGINVILSGEIQPGVYGQVQIGNSPRPPVVYEDPRVIVVDRRYERMEPIYLHVPPGHAKHWDKHCHEYNACSRRVYFVRSAEYEPNYRPREEERYERDDRDDDRGERGNRGNHGNHGHGNKHDD